MIVYVNFYKHSLNGRVFFMHQAIVNIMLDRIQDQFISEQVYCEYYLDVPYEEWQKWKTGISNLPSDKMQKMQGLFSDYEWMLIQKIARQTGLFPEKRNYVVAEYKRLKSIIAKSWIKSGLANVELITQQRVSGNVTKILPQKNVVNLRVIVNYEEWGYDDILEFCMPGVIQQQIEEAQIDLLEWVDENLVDTYTEKQAPDSKE